jgi:hypothetical protein
MGALSHRRYESEPASASQGNPNNFLLADMTGNDELTTRLIVAHRGASLMATWKKIDRVITGTTGRVATELV